VSWYRFLRFVWETGFTAVELGVDGYDKARKLWKGQPAPLKAQPLTYRDVVRQQGQIRSATRRDAIPPPKPGR